MASSDSTRDDLIAALITAKNALNHIRACSIAGCDYGYGRPELWADDLYRSHGNVADAIKKIDEAMSKAREASNV